MGLYSLEVGRLRTRLLAVSVALLASRVFPHQARATPQAGDAKVPCPTNVKPLASHAGHDHPGCVCRFPLPKPQPAINRTEAAPINRTEAEPQVAGEVEVLTIDVLTANKVRCDNASIADDVAKMLKIPVQRVTVTPWSWTLDVPQENYQDTRILPMAFVQQDHDRCDCKDESGRVVRGQGFRALPEAILRLAPIKEGADGWMVDPDTSVMTASQYLDFQSASKKSFGLASEPSPAHIQMLTRDPCLVHLLRSETSHFRKGIAHLLGMPEDKVLVEPPPVKGTVGVVLLETVAKADGDVQPVEVLAVRHCDSAASKSNMLAANESNELPHLASQGAEYQIRNVTKELAPPVNESNRPWIAFWSVVLLPPFANDRGWKMLRMVDNPSSELSHLLPMTLARVPGLKYHGFDGPNAIGEVRLPPPEDKAHLMPVRLPAPLSRRAVAQQAKDDALQVTNQAQADALEAALVDKEAQDTLRDAKQTSTMIKQADAKFLIASRMHAQAMLAPGVKAPDIVNPNLFSADANDESPYLIQQREKLLPKTRLRRRL